MIIDKSDTTTTNLTSTAFGINTDNAEKIFNLVIQKLYTDPLNSMALEVIFNAIDSHRSTGIDKPVDIHLPTLDEPYFTVRDYGKGLTPEDMQVYTTLFKSTKEKDAEQYGGYGLGAKAPFAYCDAFTLTSYTSENIRDYLLFIKNDIPQYTLIAERPSDNTTGVTIHVPMNHPKDTAQLILNKELIFLKDKVNCNKPITPITTLWESPSNTGGIYELPALSYYATVTTTVRIGDRLYNTDNLNLPFRLTYYQEKHKHILITINAPMSSTFVTPSKEHIVNNHTSKMMVMDAVKSIIQELDLETQTRINQSQTHTEAVLTTQSLRLTLNYLQHKKDFFYNDGDQQICVGNAAHWKIPPSATAFKYLQGPGQYKATPYADPYIPLYTDIEGYTFAYTTSKKYLQLRIKQWLKTPTCKRDNLYVFVTQNPDDIDLSHLHHMVKKVNLDDVEFQPTQRPKITYKTIFNQDTTDNPIAHYIIKDTDDPILAQRIFYYLKDRHGITIQPPIVLPPAKAAKQKPNSSAVHFFDFAKPFIEKDLKTNAFGDLVHFIHFNNDKRLWRAFCERNPSTPITDLIAIADQIPIYYGQLTDIAIALNIDLPDNRINTPVIQEALRKLTWLYEHSITPMDSADNIIIALLNTL